MFELYRRIKRRLGLNPYEPIPSHEQHNSLPASRPPNPKGFFANERTLLSWLHFSVVLGALAVAIINQTDSKSGLLSASLFAVLSIAIMLISYYNFRWRAAKLKEKEFGYYDDLKTPVVLLIFFLIAVAFNIWVQIAARLL